MVCQCCFYYSGFGVRDIHGLHQAFSFIPVRTDIHCSQHKAASTVAWEHLSQNHPFSKNRQQMSKQYINMTFGADKIRVSSLLLAFSCLLAALFTSFGSFKTVNKTVFFTSIIGARFVVQCAIFMGLVLWIAIDFGPVFSKILIFYTFTAFIFPSQKSSAHFGKQWDQIWGWSVYFWKINLKTCYRFVKTMSDDAGRIPLHVGVICFHMCGKLQCQLILEHHCEKSLHARQPHWCIPRETAATVTISHLAWKELMHFWPKERTNAFLAWKNQCIFGIERTDAFLAEKRTNAFLGMKREPMHFEAMK